MNHLDSKLKKEIPDSEVEIIKAVCKCGGHIMATVKHHIDKAVKKELADLAIDGFNIVTIPLLQYREEDKPWCNGKCNDKKDNQLDLFV